MTPEPSSPPPSFKLRYICDRFGVSEHDAKHVLSQGFVPPGTERAPGRGRHRSFDARAAFWLGVVLRLKAIGLQVPFAAKVANYLEVVKTRSVSAGDDPWIAAGGGRPAGRGRPARWVLEIGDDRFVRVKSDLPGPGKPSSRAWLDMSTGEWVDSRPAVDPRPLVVLRVNLTEVARVLSGRAVFEARRTSGSAEA